MTSPNPTPDPLRLRDLVRQSENELIAALGPPNENLKEYDIDITLSDGHHATTRVWCPADKTSPSARPLILLFHGGGFVSGSYRQCTRPAREFALEFGAVVVSPGTAIESPGRLCVTNEYAREQEYRLAPEHKWPRAMLDGLEVLDWVANNAETKLGANLSAGFIVGGYSAGGQLAAVVASEARTSDLSKQITGSFLCIPSLFVEQSVPTEYRSLWKSRDENNSEMLTKNVMEMLVKTMQADGSSPLFSPLNSSIGLHGLPPTYIQVGEKDLLRDDGVIYEKLLQHAGIPTRFDTYADLGHESWTIWTDEESTTGKVLKENTLKAMRWLLNAN